MNRTVVGIVGFLVAAGLIVVGGLWLKPHLIEKGEQEDLRKRAEANQAALEVTVRTRTDGYEGYWPNTRNRDLEANLIPFGIGHKLVLVGRHWYFWARMVTGPPTRGTPFLPHSPDYR